MEERRRIAVVFPKYGLVGGLRGNARERMGREALQTARENSWGREAAVARVFAVYKAI